MNIILFDESKKRLHLIENWLKQKNHSVTTCLGSAVFLDAINEMAVDKVFIEYDSWKHSRAIFYYFEVNKLLKNIPVVFYNTNETTINIAERTAHTQDRVVRKDAELELVVSEL